MRSARSSMLLAMTLLAPAVAATPAAAQSVAFVSDLVGDPALAPLVADPIPELQTQALPAGPQAMSEDELSEARGGFMTAGGFTFGFGVVVRSFVNDQLALQTRLTWTPKGASVQQTHHAVPGVTDLASAMESLVAGGIDLRGLSNTGGVALIDTDGATAVLHNITTSQLQSLIVNNGDNRNIRQDMELNLVLPDLATIQSNSRFQSYGAQIVRDMDWAGLAGLGG